MLILLITNLFRLLINGKPSVDGRLASVFGDKFVEDLEDSLKLGFQQVIQQGPLCAEPLHGLMFIIHELNLESDEGNEGENGHRILSQATIDMLQAS